MQLLILAHAFDHGASAVADVLSHHLGSQLTVLRPEWLGQAQWSHRVSSQGRAQTRIRWQSGALESAEVGLVWNRIRLLPQANFRNSAPADRDYAAAEMQALVTSFLAELGDRVVPPLHRHVTLTPTTHFLEWSVAALQCGLQLHPDPAVAPSSTVLVTPETVVGPPTSVWPASLFHACHGLAARLGFDFLELSFAGAPQSPLLCRINSQPSLTSIAEVNTVAQWLMARARASDGKSTVQSEVVL